MSESKKRKLFDHEFTLSVCVLGRTFEVLGIERLWNPLPGFTGQYPLPSEKVTELWCPEADDMCTWGETREVALKNITDGLTRWLNHPQERKTK